MKHFLSKGVVLEQFKRATLDKPLRKLLPAQPDTPIVCFDPDDDDNIRSLTAERLIATAERCQVRDKLDHTFLADKLRDFCERGISVPVITAMDDEPYLTDSLAVVLQKQKAFSVAVACLQSAFSWKQMLLATYNRDVPLALRMPKTLQLKNERYYCRYPAKSRLLTHYADSDRYGFNGAEALLHLYRALVHETAHESVIITVAGTAVGSPCNMEVAVGTPISEVLAHCNLTCDPAVVIRGGSMTGRAVTDLSETIDWNDRAILAFEEQNRKTQYECVGCGRCSRVCTRGLMPDAIYKSVRAGMWGTYGTLRAEQCVECGCCSFVCPSNIDLLQYIRKAKVAMTDRRKDAQEPEGMPLYELTTQPDAPEATPAADFADTLEIPALGRTNAVSEEADPEPAMDILPETEESPAILPDEKSADQSEREEE